MEELKWDERERVDGEEKGNDEGVFVYKLEKKVEGEG